MQGAGQLVIKSQIAFFHTRKWMCTRTIQFVANPTRKILSELLDLLGPRKIEHILKPAFFSIANSSTHSSAPLAKKQKINLNTPLLVNCQNFYTSGYTCGQGPAPRGRGYGSGRGNLHQYKRVSFPHTPSKSPKGYTII